MDILDQNQLEILQSVRGDRYRGVVPFEEVQGDVDLLLELRIIEPSGACPYRLIEVGTRILALAQERRTTASSSS